MFQVNILQIYMHWNNGQLYIYFTNVCISAAVQFIFLSNFLIYFPSQTVPNSVVNTVSNALVIAVNGIVMFEGNTQERVIMIGFILSYHRNYYQSHLCLDGLVRVSLYFYGIFLWHELENCFRRINRCCWVEPCLRGRRCLMLSEPQWEYAVVKWYI